MKTLIFGAGPLGLFYAHLLNEAGKDVTILARGTKYNLIRNRELKLIDGFSGKVAVPSLKTIDHLANDDAYDLVVVLVRKNQIPSVIESLSECPNLGNILFMGNNAAGFRAYRSGLANEKLLFGFPGAGGGWNDAVSLEIVDRESPSGKRMPIRVGEMDGVVKARTRKIQALIESSGIPVELVTDIDGWLKYHAAFVIPIGCAIYRHGGDLRALAKDRETLRLAIRASKEAGLALRELGYTKRQPFKFNLFYWLPEFVTARMFRGIFQSRYAEVAFARHAEGARDEFGLLVSELRSLAEEAGVEMPNFEESSSCVSSTA